MAQLPAIQATRKSGKECFQGIGGEYTLQDFWAWAFSDLVSNTERGKLAEYLVAKAMGCGTQISQTWESYDLLSPEGIKIEVKTSAYIQSWKQKAFSKISFGIAKTKFWDGLDYVGEKKRHTDVYVFCVLKHKDQETINPLELAQRISDADSGILVGILHPIENSVQRPLESGILAFHRLRHGFPAGDNHVHSP